MFGFLQKKKHILSIIFLATALTLFLYFNKNIFVGTVPSQTDVNRAEHVLDSYGIPYLKIQGVGKYRHPAWIATYALAYAGVEYYDERLKNSEDKKKFWSCIEWLEENLEQRPDGLWVWNYDFDSTYNDVSIKAPWASPFAQAIGIQAFLTAYRIQGDKKYLEFARKAASPLFVPLQKNGFLFERGEDIWFEEIPSSVENPSHILNGHMRVLLALKELADVTGDSDILNWYRKGADTLYRWLPKFDAGYWVRYDLNPQKKNLLFRFANPYGFKNHALAVDKITLRDPINSKEVVLDVGTSNDAKGENYIAGIHWGQPEVVAGRTVRKLVPAALDNTPDKMSSPYTYFYISLPSEWKDNLRDESYELIFDYYDEAPSNITVQQRSIAPGSTFRDMRDGDLHLSGAKQWRRWMIPLRVTDLGYWVGQLYAEKHAEYLSKISKWDERFRSWALIAEGYKNSDIILKDREFKASSHPMPQQTPMVPIYSLDPNGVVMQHKADKKTKWKSNGQFNPIGGRGTPVYSPFIVAEQLLQGAELTGADYSYLDRSKLKRYPALKWLLNKSNYLEIDDSAVYNYQFDNNYNDISTKSPWSSSFGQAYVLKALIYACENGVGPKKELKTAVYKTAKAFDIPIENEGIKKNSIKGTWFEEVPNSTHVLNAHLVSIAELFHASRALSSEEIRHLYRAGLQTLKNTLYLFDTGYWFRYDQNPKKDLLIQLDWLSGAVSPIIDEVFLLNAQTGQYSRVDIGALDDYTGTNQISGSDWLPPEVVDGKSVRAFSNGYAIHKKSVNGGTRHNVYLKLHLPFSSLSDFFEMPNFKLIIKYKDVGAGMAIVKTQSINNGNELKFVPLRGGLLSMEGSGGWKSFTVTLRPQDLGWYKGQDYESYEIEQIQRLANFTNDWFFYQYAERHSYFLEMQKKNMQVVIDDLEDFKNDIPLKLQVVNSSRTYPGYGFENAIDESPNDNYVAGIENVPGYVTLKLSRPVKLSSITLHWESLSNMASRVRLSVINERSSVTEILNVKLEKALVSTISLPKDLEAIDKLRIDFEDILGQPRILLRQIILKESTKLLTSNLSPFDPGGIYMAADDPRNPLKIFRLPITMRLKNISDALATGIKSDSKKVEQFLKYINRFRVGFSSNAVPDTIIEERLGSCGDFSNLLLTLAAVQGIKGRLVNLMNYPISRGHTVVELYIDGDWRLYDPTYSTYYMSRGTGSISDHKKPISFKAIRQAYKSNPESVVRISGTYRNGFDDFTGKGIYLYANPAGVIGPDRPFYFPLTLDFSNSNFIDSIDFGTKYQGANYLGAAPINQNQIWTLKGLKKGNRYEFVAIPNSIGGDILNNDRSFLLISKIEHGTLLTQTQQEISFFNKETPKILIRFIAHDSSVNIKLSHPYSGPDYRYLEMKSYQLRSLSEL